MSELKPFASLSSGLLARKGGAKPAMRPQGFNTFGGNLEDLGWNDMGGAAGVPADAFDGQQDHFPEHVPSSIAALTPAPKPVVDVPMVEEAQLVEEPVTQDAPPEPPVVEQQRAEIEARFGGEDRPVARKMPATIVPIASRQRAVAGAKARAAFTLRLDPDRHLRLRLSCAVSRRSAQQIVTQALDEYLKSVPGIDALVEQVPVKAGKRS